MHLKERKSVPYNLLTAKHRITNDGKQYIISSKQCYLFPLAPLIDFQA